MRRSGIAAGLVVFATLGLVGTTRAAVPGRISYQGQLLDSEGIPIERLVSIVVRIWDAPSGGNPLFEEAHESVRVQRGLFQIEIGSVDPISNPLLGSMFGQPGRWLGVTVDGEELVPRQAFGSVPFALRAEGAVTAEQADRATLAVDADRVDGREAVELDQASEVADLQGRVAVLEGMSPGGAGGIDERIRETGELLARPDLASAVPVSALRPVDCSDPGTTLSFLVGGSPLGEVRAWLGREAVSESAVHVVAVRSADVGLQATDFLGSRASLVFQRGLNVATRDGFITDFGLAAQTASDATYVVTIEPQVALELSRFSGYGIHQGRTVPEIVTSVLRNRGLPVDNRLLGAYLPREFTVQYNETDFAFVSRLMEREGIHYHFEHRPTGSELVMGDSPAAFGPSVGTLSYFGHLVDRPVGEEFVATFHLAETVVTDSATVGGFDFERPSLTIRETRSATPTPLREFYEYPSDIASPEAAGQRATVNLERQLGQGASFGGTTTSPDLRAGHVFDLDGIGTRFDGGYLVTRVQHALTPDPAGDCLLYGNAFTAVTSTTTYRPPRRTPVPRIGGVHSAIVTGPAGEEIFTDGLGRVKVQFHWDREGQFDENSSLWMRVSHPAGHGDFETWIPRVGSEVLVTFVQGDPDRPVIVGSVYNGQSPPGAPLRRCTTYPTVDAPIVGVPLVLLAGQSGSVSVGCARPGEIPESVEIAVAEPEGAPIDCSAARVVAPLGIDYTPHPSPESREVLFSVTNANPSVRCVTPLLRCCE